MKNVILTIVLNLIFVNLISSQGNLPDYLPKNGLVGWWPFNGNANDESGNGNNGIISGPLLTFDRFGKTLSAFKFNTTNKIIVNNHSSLQLTQNISISFWVYLLSNGQTLIRKNNDYGVDIGNADDTQAGTHLIFFPQNLFSTQQIPLQTWSHVVVVKNGLSRSIYIDGKLNLTGSNNFIYNITSSALTFGSWNNELIDAKLDDIGIWNRALTSEEVIKLYEAKFHDMSSDFTADLIANKSTTICKDDSVILSVKLEAPSLKLGSKGPAGGIVFYDKGTNSGGWRYLESAPENIGLYSWGCDGLSIPATSTSGFINSTTIINNCTDSVIAAKKCIDFTLNGFDDWYLPSQFEFSQIYNNLILNDWGNFKVGPIPGRGTLYWTSNQLTTSSGSHCCLECGGNFYQYSKIYELYVRPVRRFTSPEFTEKVSYKWSTGETSASITINPQKETIYYVTVTNGAFSVKDSIVIMPFNCCKNEQNPKNNLIASWNFCGNLLDASGNGHHGKVKVGTESYTMDRHCNDNQALLLDGATYLEIPHHPSFNGFPFTISAWIKTTTGGHIVNKYVAAAWNGWTLYASVGESSGWYLRSRSDAMISQYDNFPAFGTQQNAADGEWHLLTFTVDDSLGYVYLDGNLQDTQIWRGKPGKCTSSFPIRIGFYTGDNLYFKGAVDDIAVWDRRLSHEEVKSLYFKDECLCSEPVSGTAISYQRGKATCSLNDYKDIIPECWEWKYSLCSRRYKFAGSSTRVNGVLTLLYDKEKSDLQTLINRKDYTGPRYLGRSDEYECFICEIIQDDGGRITESRHNSEEPKFSLYPNPFDEEVIIDISGDQTEEIIITLTDVLGRVCHTEMVQTTNYPYTMEVNQELQGGIYFLRIADKSGQVMYQTKLIRQN